MLDPGRYFAEAIYFLQWALAQILWAVARATLSIALIAESINSWVTENVGYFVELLTNALSAPLGAMFILALTALGVWYALNNLVPTSRWVDPSKLVTYGFLAFFFFSSPVLVIEMLEDLRQALNAGIDPTLLDGAAGELFEVNMEGTDPGLPGTIPDVNSDGVLGSFDLVAAFLLVANLDELDSSEFPVDFEATYFPFGDPAGLELSDEADQQLAKALASDGIERLFFAGVAIPTAIAEHFLHLALTGVAMLLYAGVPFAMLLSFFVYTQSFLLAYLRQFINLLIETLLSVIITAIMVTLLAAAAQQGIGLYIAASLITCFVLVWRIQSALKLATAAFHLFGGASLTGGAGGMELVNLGKKVAVGTAGVAGAALTGGVTAAAAGGVLAAAGALQLDGRAGGAYLGTDPAKTAGRVRQLQAIGGYTAGKSPTARQVIEGAHEARTLARNFRDGQAQDHPPDTLDYLRAGSSMSSFGSSPWMAMRLSPSLRAAYDQIGGRTHGTRLRDTTHDEAGEPVALSGRNRRGRPPDEDLNSLWRDQPATPRQLAYLQGLGIEVPEMATRGQASDLIEQARSQPVPEHPSSSWRDEPATSRQLAYLQQLGVEAPDMLTRGQATDLIDQARHDRPGGARGHRGHTDMAPGPELARHFANLEQALAGLTAALSRPGTLAGQPAESVNGPIPDWLRDDGSDTRPVQEVNVVSTAPDLDRDGREDKYETGSQDVAASRPAGRIVLEPAGEARQQTLQRTLAHLTAPHTPAGQAAAQLLVHYTGERNAALIQEAVAQHAAPAVQAAASVTAAQVARYREEGFDDAAILAAFQSGAASAALRQQLETPLSEAQLEAVADMVLLPQRHLTRPELVAVIGQAAAAGATSEQAVTEALGMPVDFGPQTGNVRGVLAGAQALALSPHDLAHLAERLQAGLQEAVMAELLARGHRPALVQDFVSDLAALPTGLAVPQSTARPVTAEEPPGEEP